MTPEKIERNFEACGLRVDKVATKLVMALCRDAFNAGLEEAAKIVAEHSGDDMNIQWDAACETVEAAIRARLSQKEEQKGK